MLLPGIIDEHFSYDFSNGLIYRKLNNRLKQIGLCKNTSVYHQINVDGKMKLVHKVLFEKYHGKILEDRFVDHIDRDKTNNSIFNLRLVSRSQNNQNVSLYKSNTSGHKNIAWYKRDKKWCVSFTINGKNTSFGYLEHIEDAIQKRNEVILDLNSQGHCFSKI